MSDMKTLKNTKKKHLEKHSERNSINKAITKSKRKPNSPHPFWVALEEHMIFHNH